MINCGEFTLCFVSYLYAWVFLKKLSLALAVKVDSVMGTAKRQTIELKTSRKNIGHASWTQRKELK